MPPSRGARSLHSYLAREGTPMEKQPGASLWLWAGIATAVLGVALVLVFVFWPGGSGPSRSEDQLQQERENMIKQIHMQNQPPDKGKKK